MTLYYNMLRIPRLLPDTDLTNENICLTFNRIYTTLTPTKRKSLAIFHKALAQW